MLKRKTALTNPKVYRDYEVIDIYDAGIELKGSEVKSIRLGKASLQGSYCGFKKNELFVFNFHISPYQVGSAFNPDPLRPKKLLLKRNQLDRIFGIFSRGAVNILPLEVYFDEKNLAKMKIGLCKHLKKYDKREMIKRKDIERQIRREIKW